MAVIQTQKLLYQVNEMSKQELNVEVMEAQRKIICAPLKSLFPTLSEVEIHYELLRNGLFNLDEDEELDLEKTVKKLEEQNIWRIVKDEFSRLQSHWQGPNVPIWIYPLTKYRPIVEGKEVKKNGVTFQGGVFLFLSTELDKDEIKVLFAHEYHHSCRLAFLSKAPSEMKLADSLVIEGMAECAVEEVYGENWLSPWTKKYSFEECLNYWNEHFVPFLQLKGVKNHHPFLYGVGNKKYPLWIGYCMGYRIVQSYFKNCGAIPIHLLTKMPTVDIIAGSDFKL